MTMDREWFSYVALFSSSHLQIVLVLLPSSQRRAHDVHVSRMLNRFAESDASPLLSRKERVDKKNARTPLKIPPHPKIMHLAKVHWSRADSRLKLGKRIVSLPLLFC